MTPEPWTVVVTPLAGEVPADVRVRRWLKAGLRGFGLKCVVVRNPTTDEALLAERLTSVDSVHTIPGDQGQPGQPQPGE